MPRVHVKEVPWVRVDQQAEYQRFLTPGFKPFDPVSLARETESIVCNGELRKYTAFYVAGVYGGIATGYTVGCCYRCFYCWVDWSRDFPEKYGKFYTPHEAFENLKRAAAKRGVKKLRISGAEPTLGRRHLLGLLGEVEESEFPLFVLETNGVLFGHDKEYVRSIAPYSKVHVRVSLKAGTPEGLMSRTGAIAESFELPYQAIRNLIEFRLSFHVACMSDFRVMPEKERRSLLKKLNEIDTNLVRHLEEEAVDPYRTTLARMEAYGIAPREFF